jgi:endonuclease III
MKSPATVRRIIETLAAQHPNADTELHYSNAFELLVATILSAQSTDARVNMVTPALFKRYPDAQALARAKQAALEKQLCDRLPPAMWTLASDVQILHGRRVCRPTKPLCDQCPVADECVYFAALQREARGPKAAKARAPAAGRKQKGMRRR